MWLLWGLLGVACVAKEQEAGETTEEKKYVDMNLRLKYIKKSMK
jgi:hypothetical protein